MNKKKIFIGVAWPYVNGELHVGHLAGYLLPADITARFFRATGHDVLMASGSDCFGTPITVEADKKKVTPKEIVDLYHEKDVKLFIEILGLTYDIYTKTDTQNHIQITQDFFLKFLEKNVIIIDTTKQYYSSEDKKFLPDRYVEGKCRLCGFEDARSDQCDNCGKLLEQGDLIDPRSKLTGKKVELKDTQHYFIDWPKLETKLKDYVTPKQSLWKNWVYQETMGWIKNGLKPRAISRDIEWGVPLPIDRIPEDKRIDNIENKRLYVWFEAVIGYYSASVEWGEKSGRDWKEFWYGENLKHYNFMGKDNLVFHTIFWPGQLMTYDEKLHLPDVVSINMFLNLKGKQFSKSRGVTIPIVDVVEKYGNDPLRFYLTLIMPENSDSSFTFDDFIEKNNEILVANLGNFIHRSLSLAQGADHNKITSQAFTEAHKKLVEEAFRNARIHLEKCQFKLYLEEVLKLSAHANKFINDEKVWEQKSVNSEEFYSSLRQLYGFVIALGFLISPIMPKASRELFKQIGVDKQDLWPELGEEAQVIEQLLSHVDTSIKPSLLFKKFEVAA
ncbi:MAG: methionine--tRNA ligase [Patescibacteria group bacterium]